MTNRTFATAVTFVTAILIAACSSAPPPAPLPETPTDAGASRGVRVGEPLPAPSAPSLASITAIEVRDTAAGASRLEVVADQPLVWTSYRNAGGDYVLELVGAEPAPGVAAVTPAGSLIERLELEVVPMLARAGRNAGDAKRMTRLTVHTRSEAAHALRTVGTSLRLTFTPAEAHAGRAPRPDVIPARPSPVPSTPPPAIASEDLTPDPPPPAAPPAVEISATEDAPAIDDAPVVTTPPPAAAPALLDASPADALLAIEAQPQTGDRVEIRLIGNGTILAGSPFRLRQPARLVLDLPGLVNRVRAKTLHVGSTTVDRVRVGQFRADPPTARVVLDLADPNAELRLQPTPDGLLLTVERP